MATLDGLVRENPHIAVDIDFPHYYFAVCESHHQYGHCYIRIFQLAANMVVPVCLQHYDDHFLLYAEHILLKR